MKNSKLLLGAMIVGITAFGISTAEAVPVTFSTTGVFSVSGTNVANFTNANGTTTATFNGTTNPVDTPAGASFGDIVLTTTVPAGQAGPSAGGTFTLNIVQAAPAASGSLGGTLGGTFGFNTGIATLSFATTSVQIDGFLYSVNPSYTLALPVTGVGGGAGSGTTTIQGTITAVPDSGATIAMLGAALMGLAALRRRFV